MVARIETASVGPVGESILAVAQSRIGTSDDGDRFEDLVFAYVTSETDGRHPVAVPERLDEDTVRTAAYIEALAGLRRLRARYHRLHTCPCDGCRVRRSIKRALSRKDVSA
jgi:hypothetical protein